MSEAGSLICWKCTQRTPPGECIHCGAALSKPDEAFDDKREEVPVERSIIIPSSDPDQEDIKFPEKELIEIIERHFVIKLNLYRNNPQFVVQHPGANLDEKFDQMITQTNEYIPGIKPFIEKYRNTEDLLLRFGYTTPPKPQEYRTVFILGIFTVVSILFAGLYNGSQLLQAQDISTDSGLNFFTIIINLDTFMISLMYTATLVFLIGLKDSLQLRRLFDGMRNNITPFYIPAPPIFELGTFGSINRQDHIFESKQKMYSSVIVGPLISWFVSILMILFSLPLAEYNPEGAVAYSDHSIVANGRFEPFILQILAFLSNSFGLTSLDLSQPLTTTYIFHPLTYAALAGFYISALSLLPATHFNGGYIVRSAFGKRGHVIFTYLTVIAVYFINWALSIFVFFIHEILKTPPVMNEESEVSKNYRYLLIPFFLIIILSFPFRISILDAIFW